MVDMARPAASPAPMSSSKRQLSFEQDGVEHHPAAAAPVLQEIIAALAPIADDRAGIRLFGNAELAGPLSAGGPVGAIAARHLGAGARPVRALLFDKSAKSNWSLGWHQDRTIAVHERHHVRGFGPWTVKNGRPHVVPPTDLLSAMLTLRVHLDPVGRRNAPLRVAPGSHRLGRIPERRIESVVKRCGEFLCLAEAGDTWAYSTLILHASAAAQEPRARRVLHVDFAAHDLPDPLRWLGIG